MNLFRLADPFQVVPGVAPISVGAPHHGTRPHVDADLGTGPIALALASQLTGRAVVVSDMRRVVDANKSPLRFGKTARSVAVRYQNELFWGMPCLVIEIHGHVSGKYDVEISTGFSLDSTAEGDASYLKRLQILKESLPGAIASRIGIRPSVGIYPLDQDVCKTATDTFTFQKIRRARNLAGLDWFGLHIELCAGLRTSKAAQSPAYIASLAKALALAISAAFGNPISAVGLIPTHSDFDQIKRDRTCCRPFKAMPAPDKYNSQEVILLHPGDLESMGALDGDALILNNGDDSIRVIAISSLTVRSNHIALPARLRGQISLQKHQMVMISRPKATLPDMVKPSAFFAAGEIHPGRDPQLWLSPAEASQLGLFAGDRLRVQGQPISLQHDPALPVRVSAISSSLADRLTITIGEVVEIEKAGGKL